jgi:hypothetical protein
VEIATGRRTEKRNRKKRNRISGPEYWGNLRGTVFVLRLRGVEIFLRIKV